MPYLLELKIPAILSLGLLSVLLIKDEDSAWARLKDLETRSYLIFYSQDYRFEFGLGTLI